MNDLPIAGGAVEGVSQASSWADFAGLVASVGCAIHCAAMPLVLAYLPMLGLSWMAGEGFHQWMAAICFGLAALAFVPGWRRHGSLLPATWGMAGVLLLATAAFGLEGTCCAACSTETTTETTGVDATPVCTDTSCAFCSEAQAAPKEEAESTSLLTRITPFVTPLGGLLLIVGHINNHRKSCACHGGECCSSLDGCEE